MSSAIGNWLIKLQNYPGWEDWKRSSLNHTLFYDYTPNDEKPNAPEFIFSKDIDRERKILLSYMNIVETVNSFNDIEWYFRRYPFSGTPISRHKHIIYCIEMYFSRFYQFKERLKKLLNILKNEFPDHKIDISTFIKQFDSYFNKEIQMRHTIHHHDGFEDIETQKIFLTETLSKGNLGDYIHKEHLSHYRKTANSWASRVRRESKRLNMFIDAVAILLFKICPFIDDTEHETEIEEATTL